MKLSTSSIPSPIPNDELIGVTAASELVKTTTRADPTPSPSVKRVKVGSTVVTPSNTFPQSKIMKSCNDLEGIDRFGKCNNLY